jgi:hypothetical protein
LSDWCSHISSSYSVCSFFFCFRGGQPLHKVQFNFCNMLDIPVACFTNSSPKAFLSNLLAVLSLPSCTCSLKSQFLVPLVPSRHISCPLPSIRPFHVPLANLFLVWFFRRPCLTDGPSWLRPLCCATFAQRVIFLLAAANSFCGPKLLWVWILLKTLLLRRAIAAQWDTFL